MSELLNFRLLINADDLSVEDLDDLTRRLMTELVEFESVSANLVRSKSAITASKSGDPIVIGALAVAVLPAVLPKVIELLQAWTLRQNNQHVTIKIQSGKRLVELTFPATMSSSEILAMANNIKKEMGGKRYKPPKAKV